MGTNHLKCLHANLYGLNCRMVSSRLKLSMSCCSVPCVQNHPTHSDLASQSVPIPQNVRLPPLSLTLAHTHTHTQCMCTTVPM